MKEMVVADTYHSEIDAWRCFTLRFIQQGSALQDP